jgi:hypothetical protein
MLLLADNETKEWKDVPPDDKKQFVEKLRSELTDMFEKLIRKLSGDVVAFSAAGKSTDVVYTRLLGLKKNAPLLHDRCADIYSSSCVAADKAIKRRMVADTVAGMTARAGRSESINDISSLIEGFIKLENTPEAEIGQAQAAAFKTVAKERALVLAGNQFDAYKSAVDMDKQSDADNIKKDFDDWINTVTEEYGKVELDELAKQFGIAKKAAEERRKAAVVKKSQIVNKTHPKPDEPTPPAVTVKDEPAPPAEVAKSYLKITVSPSKATVKIDDREVKAGIVEVEPDRNHMVEITCPGYKAIKQFYRVESGETRSVDILLQKGKSRSLFGF